MDSAGLSFLASMANNVVGRMSSFGTTLGALFSHGWKGLKRGYQSMSDAITGAHLTGAQNEANAFEAQQAQNQMEFQERMSNTAHQREVADMKAAGLNPALLYGSGASGASSPSGAMAASESPGAPDVIGLMGALANLSLLKAQRDNIRSQIKERDQSIKESAAREAESRSRTRMNDLIYRYYPSLTQSQLNKDASVINSAYQTIEESKHKVAFVDAETALTETRNFVEQMQGEWIDRLNEAKTSEARANVVRAFAAAAYDNYFVSYGKSHGGQLPGYNQALGIASAIEDVIGKLTGNHDLDIADEIGKAVRNALSGGR